jgi:hypothetical protein
MLSTTYQTLVHLCGNEELSERWLEYMTNGDDDDLAELEEWVFDVGLDAEYEYVCMLDLDPTPDALAHLCEEELAQVKQEMGYDDEFNFEYDFE